VHFSELGLTRVNAHILKDGHEGLAERINTTLATTKFAMHIDQSALRSTLLTWLAGPSYQLRCPVAEP